MIGGAKTVASPVVAAEFGGASGCEDVEETGLEEFLRLEETADKVKTEVLLVSCDGVVFVNEVCADPIDAVGETGERVCVTIETSSLEGDAVQI
jgi:hypothetical protein